MEIDVEFKSDPIDPRSGWSTEHLSCIIDLLLPASQVGGHRVKEFMKSSENDKKAQEIFNFLGANTVFTGSTSEGLNIPNCVQVKKPHEILILSDVDLMVVMKNKYASIDPSRRDKSDCSALVGVENQHPSYCRLEVCHTDRTSPDYQFKDKTTGKTFYNKAAIQKEMLSSLIAKDYKIQGPALQLEGGMGVNINNYNTKLALPIDYVITFQCLDWPTITNEWLERRIENSWYGEDLKESIRSAGCHVVAANHRLCETPDVQWRLSFAWAEGQLARLVVTDPQRQCYIALKTIYHLCGLKDLKLLTSYHLKNVFFYVCERLPLNAWENTLGACLLYLIDVLIECVEKKTIPSYFVSDNNLIDYITDDEQIAVLDILTTLRLNPIEPVLAFADKYTIGMNPILKTFREIITPILNDQVIFTEHRNIETSIMQGFLPAYTNQIITLAFEGKIKYALSTTRDLYDMLIKKGIGKTMSRAQFITFVSTKITDIKKSKAFLEEAIDTATEQDESVDSCKEILARLVHSIAYTHPEGSDEKILALIQAETLLAPLASVDAPSAEICIYYVINLLDQERVPEALLEAQKAFEICSGQSSSTTCSFPCHQRCVLGKLPGLKEDITSDGSLQINSTLVAAYVMIECYITNGGCQAVPKDLIQDVETKSQSLAEPHGLCLTGFILEKMGDSIKAATYYQSALTLLPSYQLAKQRLDTCNSHTKWFDFSSCDIT